MVLESLEIVSNESQKQLELPQILEIWSRNNEIMFEHLQTRGIPYIGITGTNRDHAEKIQDEGGAMFYGTFYDKSQDFFRLFQLYAMVGSTTFYAGAATSGNKENAVLKIIDFQNPNGTNISRPRKRLKNQGGMFPLIPDDPKTFELLERLKDKNSRLWETIRGFGPNFDGRLLGIIKPSSLKDYAEQSTEEYARHLALTRLDYQYDLARIFDMTS